MPKQNMGSDMFKLYHSFFIHVIPLPIFFTVASLALGASAGEIILKDMGKSPGFIPNTMRNISIVHII